MADAAANDQPCDLLPWDSDFFNLRVARVRGEGMTARRAAAVDQWCATHGVDWLHFLAASDDPATLWVCEEHGYRLVEVRVVLQRRGMKEQSKIEDNPAGLALRPARPEDIAALERIARRSHRDSRFYADANVPREQCDEWYARWIRNSVMGWAQAVWVLNGADGPGGYVTCHLRDGRGDIGLIAVEESCRGRGAGAMLVQRAVRWLQESGAADVSVVTQGRNVAAQRLYQRCGFVTQSLGLYYHKWLKS